MNPINDKQLSLNQKFIDLIEEYNNDNESNYYVNSKELFKHIWHSVYMLREKDHLAFD